ncbi:hypothetical protein ACFU9O_09865 [Streptomyces albidoflavus]|uniref:Uncharacterized protein n=1 Tax=Streptomyces wadayamensis TaxID=141454 RepID=A0ABR4S686_9ACTN|nr:MULTISPECIES: hypothetical protein [Streptomyces]KDR61119.1 hypothetical protein DC60_28450 [Streptomyces wadayamensis]QHC15691.1 hypothetical protein GR131_09690 [Streptomyces sp. GF20]QXQ24865.1 hypothetical protein STALF2_09190 [Streptomyces albidoflavus]QXQ30791.1 hypothetical protein STALF4_09220 [Streptomyces albidoflavus]RZE23166.1 hypothetical protein C0Q96_21245 [Streptomyces albidoflavus]
MSPLYADYDLDLWMEVPVEWAALPWKGPKQWARQMAEAWWGESEVPPARKEVKELANVLRMCAERFPASYPGFDLYLHLPDPRLMPLPAWVGWLASEGERDETLRAYVTTEDPDLLEEPLVEEFVSPALGAGLRSLRYTRMKGEQTIIAGVRYAFRDASRGVDVLVMVSAPDPRRVLAALPDLDSFAAGVSWERKPVEGE